MQIPHSPFHALPTLRHYTTRVTFPKEGRQNTFTVGCQREGEQLQQRLVCHNGCQYSGYRHLDFQSTWKTPTGGDVSQFQVTKADKHRVDVKTDLLLLLPYPVADGPYNSTTISITGADI